MVNTFHVRVLHFSNLLEIEGARKTEDFAALLEAMEYGDLTGMSDDEIREMCIMSLQDLEPVDAAYLVLKHDLGDLLRDGQIRNVAGEMIDEKMWEEYANSSLHERFFNAGSLLYAAFPQEFPKPDAVRVALEVSATNGGAKRLLAQSLSEPFLVRLLADGMDDNAVLHRLYGDQITGKSFPNADEVVWIVRPEVTSEETLKIEVISSGYWLDPLQGTKSYDSTAYADED
ncbi:MAG: hypothetical protein HQ483_00695 [Rhodospirillales bacterium]|nr:hypothetical protein [Rhodospirillales bacterium]